MRIGVLALQGGFAPHLDALNAIGHDPVAARTPEELEDCRGLVLPGGESTVQLELLRSSGLEELVRRRVREGLPVLATCAGLILAARRVTHPDQTSFGFLDVDVSRNAWGRQVHSFTATTSAELLDQRVDPRVGPSLEPQRGASAPLSMVFIRAPRITRVGPRVEVLAHLEGEPVLIRQGKVVGATFHPELTDDRRVHRLAFAAVAPTPRPSRRAA